ncbi:MAG: phosphoadenylyl-sulfate reductase [Acidobacteriaceae bacterium]
MTNFDLDFEAAEGLHPDALVERVLRLDAKACLTNSFQIEDMVVLHLLRQIVPDIPVLFLDTGYHFAETYAYRDRMVREWGLNLVSLQAEQSVADQESAFGILNQTDPTRCCGLRKVAPLMQGLQPYDIWFTGLRREQSPTRKNLRKVEPHVLPTGKTLLKVSPLADWDYKQVWSYISRHQIAYLPLYDQGYSSIGCEPCTSIPDDPNNPRSGRWSGRKLECGIHTFTGTNTDLTNPVQGGQ